MKLNRKSLPLLLIATSLLIFLNAERISAASTGPQTSGAVHYVKPGEAGDCSSWVSACELQAALALAQAGDQVWVAAGIYKPTTTDPDPRTATFQLITSVAIYGGFAGTETSLTERDWETNITTLSGDIGTPDDNADNSYHVVTGSGMDESAILDGFTITLGKANGISNRSWGGGIYNASSSPTINNVIFTLNSAMAGGGMYNNQSSPTLTNITFNDNSADYGGGIFSSVISVPILMNVTFSGNTAIYHGGGMYNNNSIPTLINVTFSGNSANTYGGGMFNANNNSFNPELTNVTFFANLASGGGGIYNYQSYAPILKNCILWANTGGQIIDYLSTATTVTFSLVQDGYTGEGNINEDPLLGPLADNGGFTFTHALAEASPAIDAGNPNICPATDQRGYYRPIDGDENGSAICDMGAYEYRSTLFMYLPLILRN